MSTDPSSLKSPITPTTPAAPPSNRASLAAPKAPKPPLSAQPTAHVGHHVHTSGLHPITVGARSVIHPYARIETARGPVEIGDGVVVWEGAVVGRAEDHRKGGGDDEDEEEEVVTKVGNNAALEAGSIVYAGASVGEASSVGAKAVVGGDAVVGEFSTLASTTKVRAGARLEPFTVLYGTRRRSDRSLQDSSVLRDRRIKAAEAQVEMSRKLLLMAGKK